MVPNFRHIQSLIKKTIEEILLFFNEAWCTRNMNINNQSNRHWCSDNPYTSHKLLYVNLKLECSVKRVHPNSEDLLLLKQEILTTTFSWELKEEKCGTINFCWEHWKTIFIEHFVNTAISICVPTNILRRFKACSEDGSQYLRGSAMT